MKFFIDSADIEEIKDLTKTGMVDGVTTNLSLASKSEINTKELIAEICKIISGPVSVDVTSLGFENIMKEALELKKISKNIVIKIPLTVDGLKACKVLSSEGIMVNVTLCFSSGQAILAAKAGAAFVSPSVACLDNLGASGMQLIDDVVGIYENYDNFNTEVIVASIKSVEQVVDSARYGAHIVTISPKIIRQLFHHPLTDSGIKTFMDD